MTDIHAHEIMHMMLEQDEVFSRESLAQAITRRFGKEARFHSCSASGMDVQAVIDFLESRGKFVALDDGFNTAQEKICNHYCQAATAFDVSATFAVFGLSR